MFECDVFIYAGLLFGLFEEAFLFNALHLQIQLEFNSLCGISEGDGIQYVFCGVLWEIPFVVCYENFGEYLVYVYVLLCLMMNWIDEEKIKLN